MSEELSLAEYIALAPISPGVYQWLENENDKTPLYVGKAKNLRARLKQYLTAEDLKTTFLMRRAKAIRWIATDNETEALLLENNLIKKHRPLYNVRLKDDKQYPYICVSTSEPFPRIYLTRRRLPGNLYFGPFSKAQVAREKIQLTLDLFPLRRRPLKLPLPKPGKPCLNYHLKKCLAPCAELISREDYAKIVEQAIAFISGSDEETRKQIEARMQALSVDLRFEEAAELRDVLQYFNERNVKPQVEMRESALDFDIVGIFSSPLSTLKEELPIGVFQKFLAEKEETQIDASALRFAQICLLKFREAKLIAKENFSLTETDIGAQYLSDTNFAETFFRDYYTGMLDLPPFIVLPDGVELSAWQGALKERNGNPVKILELSEFTRIVKKNSPEINPSALMAMAQNNARLVMRERLLAENLRNQRVGLRQLQKFLHLKNLPEIIECYDISNIQGTDPVASGIVLKDGMPHKTAYRKYQIKTVEGANDPAMMHEVLSRRLARILSGEVKAPDLIVIDGGSTQLNAALKARKNTGLKIPMVGLAKKLEEIYTEDEKILRFDKESPGMHILRRARDEAHRFAVAYHRNRRMKRNLKSLFDGIEGVGEKKRAKALLFLRKTDLGGMDKEGLAKKLKNAAALTPDLSLQIAEKIFQSLPRQ